MTIDPKTVQDAAERYEAHLNRGNGLGGTSGPYWILIESDQDYHGWDKDRMERDRMILSKAYLALVAEVRVVLAELDVEIGRGNLPLCATRPIDHLRAAVGKGK